ncbi:MAG: LysR family transcriptional regulator [Clostridiales bacterium]|nr:LysR family transcriptional regulator [Clostridiales bacterium]
MDTFTSSNYIHTIARLSSISAAAEKIGISQPALSSYLKKQEEQLGVVLFDRSKQPLELTEEGRIYLEYADKFKALNKEFKQHINDLESMKRGELLIGGASFFNVTYLPRAVAQFNKKYPGISMGIIDGKIPEITTMALNGQLDLFITPISSDDDSFHYERLLEEKIFVCVPADWKIEGDTKDFSTFKDQPFVILKKDQHIGQIMEKLFKKHGFRPKRYVVVEQTMTSYALTLAGVGISLITESCIKNEHFNKGAYSLYNVDPEICAREIYVAYPRSKYLSVAAKEFINVLKENI